MYLKCVILLCVTELLGVVIANFYTPSRVVGRRVAKYDRKKSRGYPFELGLGYYYQGDIMLVPPKKGRVSVSESKVDQIWPNGRVPYEILGDFYPIDLQTIQDAMDMFEEHTCVRFVKKTEADDLWVKIVNNDTGCFSYVGRQMDNAYNLINLQTPSCLYTTGTPVHEMMHAIGFYHEFTRPDRDDWININRSALREELQTNSEFDTNFGKLDANEVDTYNVSYNYGSVMHYSMYAGAKSFEYPVLTNKQPWNGGDFGNDDGFAESDIEQVNIRYKCSRKKTSPNRRARRKKLNKSKILKST
ncbi:astacin-like [Uranotaenia lowii]|uniref:astacin-like n=1 Tax=Uranotaenia lowii TaxID=190385 RepID=UPI00247AED01|nr:astacin-like [Uranotaenia lowii]